MKRRYINRGIILMFTAVIGIIASAIIGLWGVTLIKYIEYLE